MQRAVAKLLSHQDRTGGLHRPCAGRAIESALTFHLLRDLPSFDRHAARVERFCRGVWETARHGATGHPLGDIDHAVSKALIAVALGLPERAALVRELHVRLSTFAHPSQRRKSQLFAVLLAALDPNLVGEAAAVAPDLPGAFDQKWTRLMTIAANLLGGAGATVIGEDHGGIDELARSQLPNGSWDSHILLTVIALIALRRARQHPEIVARGVEFLLREMRDDGGIPFVPDVDVWLTALAGFAMTQVDPAPDLEALAGYIARNQLASGAWAFRSGVDTADADDTGMCVLFLQRCGTAAYKPQIERGRHALLRFRNADGGFSTYRSGAPSEAEITARAIMALGTRDGRYASHVDTALQWLDGAQAEDGSFRIEWTLCANYPIAQALSAVSPLAPRHDLARRIRLKSVRYLVGAQNDDGGWGAVPGASSEVLPTAYAVIGLRAAREGTLDGAIRSGARFLLAQQRADGGFDSPPDAVGPRPFLFEMDLFPTVYALLALAGATAASRDPCEAWS